MRNSLMHQKYLLQRCTVAENRPVNLGTALVRALLRKSDGQNDQGSEAVSDTATMRATSQLQHHQIQSTICAGKRVGFELSQRLRQHRFIDFKRCRLPHSTVARNCSELLGDVIQYRPQ